MGKVCGGAPRESWWAHLDNLPFILPLVGMLTRIAWRARLGRIGVPGRAGGSGRARSTDAAAPGAAAPPRVELYAETPRQLEKLQLHLASAVPAGGPVAVDTEFAAFPLYQPQLQLVQLATRSTMLACIDCARLPADHLGAFFAALLHRHELVLHSPQTDIVLLQRAIASGSGGSGSAAAGAAAAEAVADGGGPLHMDMDSTESVAAPALRLFDTQTAADLAGHGGMLGLARLVEDLAGVRLEKGETLSDWRKRPLSAEQIAYALDDVRYLHVLRDRLADDLQRLGRTEWMAEEMAEMVRSAAASAHPASAGGGGGGSGGSSQPEEDGVVGGGISRQFQRDQLWLDVRRILRLKDDPVALSVLRELAAWRDDAARSANLSPVLILRDELLVALAAAQPAREEDLSHFQGIKAPTIRFHGRTLISAIQRGSGEGGRRCRLE